MRFDYYAATVPEIPERLIASLRSGLGDLVSEVQPEKRGMMNYSSADSFLSPSGERVCMVLYGGSNGFPHVRSSGVHSQDVAGFLRRSYSKHRVSRLDVAQDFDGPGSWDRLESVCLDVAQKAGLKVTQFGDFRSDRDPDSGRTWYFGSRQSLAMVRLYEKGIQMASKARFGEPPISRDWVRLELELKPQNIVAKEKASRLMPFECWGVSHWTKRLSCLVLSSDVERVSMTLDRDHDDVRAIRHMVTQYGSVLDRVSSRLGSDEELWDFIQRLRSELRRDRNSSPIVPFRH